MAMHRPQILLEERQYQALVSLARAQKLSISAVARRLIDIGLRSCEGLADRRARALARLDKLRVEVERRHGVQANDLVGEARSDREDELLPARWQASVQCHNS